MRFASAVLDRAWSGPGRGRAGAQRHDSQDLQRQGPAPCLSRRLPGRGTQGSRRTQRLAGGRCRPERGHPPWRRRTRGLPRRIRPRTSGSRAGRRLPARPRVGRRRVADVTPDTPIAALGLDSLQRVDLVATLEKTFAGRLPDTVFSQARTLGDLVQAVQKHLIDGPRPDAPAGPDPARTLRLGLLPRVRRVEASRTHAAGGRRQPVFPRRPGRSSEAHPHRRASARQLLRLRLRRHGPRPGGRRRRQGRDRSLRHQRRRQPPGLRREAGAS